MEYQINEDKSATLFVYEDIDGETCQKNLCHLERRTDLERKNPSFFGSIYTGEVFNSEELKLKIILASINSTHVYEKTLCIGNFVWKIEYEVLGKVFHLRAICLGEDENNEKEYSLFHEYDRASFVSYLLQNPDKLVERVIKAIHQRVNASEEYASVQDKVDKYNKEKTSNATKIEDFKRQIKNGKPRKIKNLLSSGEINIADIYSYLETNHKTVFEMLFKNIYTMNEVNKVNGVNICSYKPIPKEYSEIRDEYVQRNKQMIEQFKSMIEELNEKRSKYEDFGWEKDGVQIREIVKTVDMLESFIKVHERFIQVAEKDLCKEAILKREYCLYHKNQMYQAHKESFLPFDLKTGILETAEEYKQALQSQHPSEQDFGEFVQILNQVYTEWLEDPNMILEISNN